MTRRPNILMVMTDQMAAPILPMHGGRNAKTPHLEGLAERGLLFDSAYTASPLCAPARFSMMAGQLAGRIGAFDNAAEFPSEIPTFAHYLRRLGYHTCLAGKMHFVGADQLHGFEERVTTDIYPADFGWVPDWTRPDERIDWWYHNMLSVVQAGVAERSNQLLFDDETAFQAERKLWQMARRTEERPFFLCVSFTHPHDPYACRREHWDRFRHDEIEMPEVVLSPEEMDPHSRRLRLVSDMGRYDLTEERVRNARHAYLGSIAYVDDRLGSLLQVLEASGRADDTAVVFTGDHGDMLGERGLWYKMCWYEMAARVPLVVSFPGQLAPKRVAAPVTLADLLPTFVALATDGRELDYADAPDGESLLKVADDAEAAQTRMVAGDYCGEGTVAPLVMLRQGRWKFVRQPGHPDQLYDLRADPKELTNLAGDAGHAETVAHFDGEVQRRWDLEALSQRVLASQRRRHLVHDAHMTGRHTSWDWQAHEDASLKYMRNHLDLNVLEAETRFPPPVEVAPDGER